MLIKPRIFYGLSHMKAQFMISERFLFEKYNYIYGVSLERNDFYLTFKFNNPNSEIVNFFVEK